MAGASEGKIQRSSACFISVIFSETIYEKGLPEDAKVKPQEVFNLDTFRIMEREIETISEGD
jgi:hypothetical protein